MNLNFKGFLEMAHILTKQNGLFGSITIDNNEIKMMDLKFERYPDVELKRKLLSINAKYFGKIPNSMHDFFVFDGRNAWVSHSPPAGYIQLPNDWWDYAQAMFVDGSIKEPTKE